MTYNTTTNGHNEYFIPEGVMRLMSTIYYLVRRYQRIRRVKTEDRNVRLYSYILLYGRNMVNGLSYVYNIIYYIYTRALVIRIIILRI